MNDRAEARFAAIEHRLTQLESVGIDFAKPAGTVTEADVRAAFRIFLDREPDEGGFSHYVERVRGGGFSFQDLISSMTDCAEYREKNRRLIQMIDVAGIKVAVDPDEPEFGRAIARDGTWEPHIIQALRTSLRPGDTFVDVGANVGIMSFHAAMAVGPAGKVIAFEPNPDNVQRFLQGVLFNEFSNVRMLPFAASSGHAIFGIQGQSNTYLVEANAGGRLAQAVRADDLLNDEPRVDLIKIDIEGHEPHAINGLSETIARHKPLILCEFNPRCLQANIGVDPGAFADQVFRLTDRVELVEHDGGRTACGDAAALMDLWADRGRDLAARHLLPEGMLHFDLLFRCS